ncbi:MAG: hypothetical protein KDC16_07620 [Saprospiraceae bacterium]|nr:hypothetical protein [Saprospiraceae bacterium]MCB9327673.1 hypothetical protein [Lewinellaceae bacterium]
MNPEKASTQYIILHVTNTTQHKTCFTPPPSLSLYSSIPPNNITYNSLFYLTSELYTLVVYEISVDEDSIEKYLLTTTVGTN